MANLIKIAGIMPIQIATICDHTFLDTIEGYKYKVKDCDPIKERTKDFREFIDHAVNGPFEFAAVCVRGSDTSYARTVIDDAHNDGPILAVTTGFPDGSVPTNQKLYETRAALENGADEIDFVMNWHKLIHGNYKYVQEEMAAVQKVISSAGKKSKVILETAMLEGCQITRACEYASEAGIDFVKTSTGYTSGATKETVKILMRDFNGGVKASGGITSKNITDILYALSERQDGLIDLDPANIRIGEGSLFKGTYGY